MVSNKEKEISKLTKEKKDVIKQNQSKALASKKIKKAPAAIVIPKKELDNLIDAIKAGKVDADDIATGLDIYKVKPVPKKIKIIRKKK